LEQEGVGVGGEGVGGVGVGGVGVGGVGVGGVGVGGVGVGLALGRLLTHWRTSFMIFCAASSSFMSVLVSTDA